MSGTVDDVGRRQRVVVVGQGYVGLPLALRAVDVGCDVVGFDVDSGRIDALRAGRSYVTDVSDAALAVALAGTYRPTADPADLAGFDVAVVCVPTPLHQGLPDLSAIEAAADLLAPYVRRGCCVVLESTTYPGTTTELFGPRLERDGVKAGVDFALGYSPERIDPGNQTYSLQTTPKVVSGVNEASCAAVEEFYGRLVDRTVVVESTAVAETTKLLENTFRHVNIALVNELAVFCHELGIDIWSVIAAASTKPFGYMRFVPGPGVGGHCLPVDPSYLSWHVEQRLGRPFQFVELANTINSRMPDYVFDRCVALLNEQHMAMNGATVVVLGLAYKRATGDFRESPSVPLIARLRGARANVRIVDPYVVVDTSDTDILAPQWQVEPLTTELLATADLVVLMVDHPEFEPGVLAANCRLLLDTRGSMGAVPFVGEKL